MRHKTLYAHAVAALPEHRVALQETSRSERTSVDRLALALEQCGGPGRHVSRVAILRAIGEGMRGEKDAREVVQALGRLDPRLAAWAACACAREALRFVPEGETRPLRAIETTERRLAGQATVDEAREAREGAWAAWRAARHTDRAAYAAAYDAAAEVGAYATHADVAHGAAAAAANAARDAHDAYDAAYAADAAYANAYAAAAVAAANAAAAAAADAELVRLVGVIAEALPGLPLEVIDNASKASVSTKGGE